MTAAGPNKTYTYDANGNQLTRADSRSTGTSFNLPSEISQTIGSTAYVSQFSCGPEHQRWRQAASYSNGGETTYYVGELLEKEIPVGGPTYWRHYVSVGQGNAPTSTWVNESNST